MRFDDEDTECEKAVTWSCLRCGKKMKDRRDMARHIEAKHVDTGDGFECRVLDCEYRAKTRLTLANHMRNAHKMRRVEEGILKS